MSDTLQDTTRDAGGLNGALGNDPLGNAVRRRFGRLLAPYWWAELVIGALWLAASIIILRFTHASVVTVGIITGIMFLVFAAEEFALAVVDHRMRWLWAFFGVILTAGGIVALIDPVRTFAAFAEILGVVFLLIGVMWMVQAFAEQAFNRLWWLGLISGILMVILGFWASGDFFVQRAYLLLIFAGIWALMKGITDIVRAFQVRSLAS